MSDPRMNRKSEKKKSITRLSSMVSPLSPSSCEPFNEINPNENNSPALRLLAANQRRAEELQKMDIDYPAVERPRSKTLPRNTRLKSSTTRTDSSSNCVPREKKVPSWYKDMYKEMHTSMEKESQLSKLLASDAKKETARKLSAGCMQSANYDDAPRRLGNGRSNVNHPNRKSLPNISAANFNFMIDYSKNTANRNNTTQDSGNTPFIVGNDECDSHIQKGKEIPDTDLPINMDSPNIYNKTKIHNSPKWETLVSAPSSEPNKIDYHGPKNIPLQDNDFIELNKQETKNETVKECEELRRKRTKERLDEEQRLLEQKTRDFLKLEEERHRLELKEEELKLKEQLLDQQREELERRRLQQMKDDDLEGEEIRLNEREEMRLLKLKEEELRQKEEKLLKQEQELTNLHLLKSKEEEHTHTEETNNRKQHKQQEQKQKELEEKLKHQEAEEQRLQKLKRKEKLERDHVLKLKQEERERKEKKEKQIHQLKEEELKHEEEITIKKVEELEQSHMPKLPPFGKAKYSFNPHAPGELQFEKGDIIAVIQGVDTNWMEGEHNGNIGIFPVSYVELLDNLPHPNIPISKSVNTEEMNPEEILDSKYIEPSGTLLADMCVDESVMTEVNRPEENILENLDMVEKFNLENPLQELTCDTDVVDAATSCPPEIQPGLAYARYTFKSETKCELSFKKGDEIAILKRVDDNWYEGECNGELGIVPVNYIKLKREPVIMMPESEPASLAHPVVEPKPEKVQKSGKSKDKKKNSAVILDDVLLLKEKERDTEEDRKIVNGCAHTEEDLKTNGYAHTNGHCSITDLIGEGNPHKAICKYSAIKEDEIELLLGDVVHVLEKCDDNWFIGMSERTGAFGSFPGNIVIPIH